jgi:hypothetical protein
MVSAPKHDASRHHPDRKPHHGIERTLGRGAIGIGERFGQNNRRNLPGQSPFVAAPATGALLAAVADDRVPVAIRFRLVGGCDLKRECFAVLECRFAVEPEARDAFTVNSTVNASPFFPRWKAPRRPAHRADRRIGKCPGVKRRRIWAGVQAKPNLVIILVDDSGCRGIGCSAASSPLRGVGIGFC